MNGGRLRSAVFLDRDGVLNRERGEHTWQVEDFEVLPDAPAVLRTLQQAGHLLVVITNQSGIGLGLYGHGDVALVHAYLRERLAREGVQLDDVFYCPHHPSSGRCLCRKPGGLLLERAIARHGIDPTRSVFFGDRDRDIQAAASVGVRGVLVAPNASLWKYVSRTGTIG